MRKYFILSLITFLIISGCKEELNSEGKILFNLKVFADEGGIVNNTGGSFEEGSVITIQAIPDSGYVFTGWSNGEKNNPITIMLSSDVELTASFEKVIISQFVIKADKNEVLMGNIVSLTYLALDQNNDTILNFVPELSLNDSLLATIQDNNVITEYDGNLKVYGKLQDKTDSLELKIQPDFNNWKTYFRPADNAIPNISNMFQYIGGGMAVVHTTGDLNNDGNTDILIHAYNTRVYQITDAPTRNSLIVLLNNGDNSFRDGTKEIFGTETVDLLGGATRKVDKKDINCDGYIDFIYAQNREDGRDGKDNAWANTNAAVLSNGDGTYSVVEIEPGNPTYNHLVEIISEGSCKYSVIFDTGIDYSYDGGGFIPLHNDYIQDDLYRFRQLGTFLSYDFNSDGIDDVIVHEGGSSVPYLVSFTRFDGTWAKTGEYKWENVIKIVEDYGPYGYGPNIAVVNNGKVYVSGGWFSSSEIRLYPNSKPLALMRYGTSTIGYIPNEGDTISADRGPWSKLVLFDVNESGMKIMDVIQDSEEPYNINFKDVLDLNGDGYDDIAQYPYRDGGKPIVHLNNRAGGFDILDDRKLPDLYEESIDVSSWWNPNAFFIDVNNDNLMDLIYRCDGCNGNGGCGQMYLFIARRALE